MEDHDVVEHIDQAERLFIEAFGDDVWQEILRQRQALDRPLKTVEVEAIIQRSVRLPEDATYLVSRGEIESARRAFLVAIGTSKQMALQYRAAQDRAGALLAASFDRDVREYEKTYDAWLKRFGE